MFELYLLFYLETSSSVFFTAAPDCPTLWLTFGFSGNKSKLLFIFYFYLACSLLEKNRQAEISFQIKLRAKNFFIWWRHSSRPTRTEFLLSVRVPQLMYVIPHVYYQLRADIFRLSIKGWEAWARRTDSARLPTFNYS